MQHLYLPLGQQLEDVDIVPYVASDDYKKTTFTGYLNHTGKSGLFYKTSHTSRNANELACVIQTWLVFSLLRCILGHHFKPEDFINEEMSISGEGRVVVDTTALSQMVHEEKLCGRFKALDQSSTRELLSTLQSATTRLNYHHNELRPFVMQALSVMSAARFIKAVNNHENWYDFSFRLDSLHPVDSALMTQQGWCPHQVHRYWRKAKTFEAQMVLRTSNRDDGLSHASCTSSACTSVDGVVDLPAHCTPGCSCSHFNVSQQMLNAVLAGGNIPLLRIDLDPTGRARRFTIVPSGRFTPYVAISHVWAEGLGNPSSNSLPYCQLERLANLVESFVRDTVDHSSIPTPPSLLSVLRAVFFRRTRDATPSATQQPVRRIYWIWLDTLCCPIGPSALRVVLVSRKEHIFRDAIRILALSASLRHVDITNMDMLQIGLHIARSTWTDDLWTFTEGSLLPSQLYFQFQERFVSFESLLNCILEDVAIPSPFRWGLSREVMDATSHLNRFFDRSNETQQKIYFMKLICHSIEQRIVSVATYEPACLALLASQPPLASVTTPELGMIHFWRSCVMRRLISSDVVFHELKHLGTRGFRWAPSSLLELNDRKRADPALLTSVRPKLVLGRDGVIATTAALHCKDTERRRYCGQFLPKLAASENGLWICVLDRQANNWYKIWILRGFRQELSKTGAIAFLLDHTHNRNNVGDTPRVVIGRIIRWQGNLPSFSWFGRSITFKCTPEMSIKVNRVLLKTEDAYRDINENRQNWARTLSWLNVRAQDYANMKIVREKLEKFKADMDNGLYLDVGYLPDTQAWLID